MISDYRISRLEVENFKSLVDFRMDLAKFTCLVGLNGSGKSTVLQFVDFLSELMRGNLSEWLMEGRIQHPAAEMRAGGVGFWGYEIQSV